MITNDLEVAVAARRRPPPRSRTARSSVRGLRKSYGRRAGARRRRPRRRAAARCSRCSAPTAPARRRSSRSSRATARADAGEVSRARLRPRRSASARSARASASSSRRTGSTRRITVREAVELYSAAYPHPRPADEVLELVGLGDRARRRASDALRRPAPPARPRARHRRRPRADLPRRADDRLRPGRPAPVVGADRRRCATLGKTILLTTHYMDEAQHLADRVVVIARGQVIAEGTPDTLGPATARRRSSASASRTASTATTCRCPTAPRSSAATVVASAPRTPTRDLAPLLAWAAGRGIELEALTVDPPDASRTSTSSSPRSPHDPPARSDLALLGRWLRARVQHASCATRARVVFTFAFPLVLLVLFNALNGNATVDAVGGAGTGPLRPVLHAGDRASSASSTACYTSVILGIATARDQGLLKRVRGTPLPMGDLPRRVARRRGADRHRAPSCCCSRSPIPAFGVKIYARHAARGDRHARCSARPAWRRSASRSRRSSKTADQAMPVAQLTFLPISFISGIWFPLDGAPDWLMTIAHFFPLYAHRQRVRRAASSPGRDRRRRGRRTTCGDRRSGPRSACSSPRGASAPSPPSRTPAPAVASCAARPRSPRPPDPPRPAPGDPAGRRVVVARTRQLSAPA